MSQTQNEQTLLRDLLRVMAATPDSHACYAHILQGAIQLTGADGAFVFLFAEPELKVLQNIEDAQFPDASTLKPVANGLVAGMNVNPAGCGAIWPHCVVAPLLIGGERVGMWGLVFDILPQSDRLSAEQLDTLTDAIIIITRSVRADARHEKLGRNQSEFMRIVAHDLRSPLTYIQGFGSMLSMVGDLNDQQFYYVDKIMSGITQMTGLIDNIQDAGRFDPETGFYEMQRAPCDLSEVVGRIVESHLLPAEKQELIIRKHIADDIPIINVDATMIERAITNLVDNAIKYTPNGRDVTVTVYREDDHIMIRVQDSGLGISPENQKMLFERHVRISRQEHKRVKGSGLGLFIVRSVARRHGGDAWVESDEGNGSAFFISIPLIESNLLVS
ncbi:MAG: sensor histidine kinase [Anaerolineaceae bacterium]|nr:MAG: sensor histidine kinase [Anaerolineaceae bacterium]